MYNLYCTPSDPTASARRSRSGCVEPARPSRLAGPSPRGPPLERRRRTKPDPTGPRHRGPGTGRPARRTAPGCAGLRLVGATEAADAAVVPSTAVSPPAGAGDVPLTPRLSELLGTPSPGPEGDPGERGFLLKIVVLPVSTPKAYENKPTLRGDHPDGMKRTPALQARDRPSRAAGRSPFFRETSAGYDCQEHSDQRSAGPTGGACPPAKLAELAMTRAVVEKRRSSRGSP